MSEPAKWPTTASDHPSDLPSDPPGLAAQFRGRLGSDQAVRTDRPLPVGGQYDGVELFTALRSVRVDTPSVGTGAIETRAALSSVAYFEVTISDALGAASAASAASQPGAQDGEAEVLPCVSIGLATRRFALYGRQPGWDKHSLGYHGAEHMSTGAPLASATAQHPCPWGSHGWLHGVLHAPEPEGKAMLRPHWKAEAWAAASVEAADSGALHTRR